MARRRPGSEGLCSWTFAAFLGRSPDTATSEDLRRFQVHLAKQQIGVATINAAIAALRFFFNPPGSFRDAQQNGEFE